MNVPQMNITAMLMLPVITQLGHLTARVMQDIPEMAEVVQVRIFFISLYVTVHITVCFHITFLVQRVSKRFTSV